MKILQVNNVYAEKSTGKLTKDLHDGFIREGHESIVVYGRGKGTSDKGVIRLCPDWYGKLNSLISRVTGIPYGGCLFSTLRLVRIIKREQPDVVHLQCINGNFVNIYRLIRWLKKYRIKTAVSLHAEFMYTANCGHAFDCLEWRHGCKKCPDKKKATRSLFFDRTGKSWRAMKKAFEGFEDDCVITPVSQWTEERAKQSDILKGFRFQTVLNGINAEEIFTLPESEKDKTDANTVLNVTAHFVNEHNHPKGGWYLAKLAERLPEVTFLVAGTVTPSPNLPENLILLGRVSDQHELADLYRRAKLSILVSQRETFSMPCAESLCCGTPVVGFKAGAPEQISLPEYSEFTEFGDLDGLEEIVRKWLERGDLNPAEISERAKGTYSAQTMIQTFPDVYRRI